MNLLFVIESLGSGGKERRLVSLIEGLNQLDSTNIELIVLSKNIHYLNIFDFNFKIHFLKRNILKDIKLLIRFNDILNEFCPNIVHCWDNIAAIHFAPICNFKKIPFINSMISTAPSPDLMHFFSKRYLATIISYPFSNIILTNSKAGLNSFRVPSGKGLCIYNGFDLNRVKVKIPKNEIRDKFKIYTRFIVGMTASFTDFKDYKTFVKAGEELLKKRKDITFVAIGDGPNLISIKKCVKKENSKYFQFVGNQKDVESIVNIFDIGILATYTEGISNSIIEYMALEKPVIATNGGGTDELVIDNETGYLIEKQNVRQLIEKIEFLLSHPGLGNLMGVNGKKRIVDYFSIDKMINNMNSLYKNILK